MTDENFKITFQVLQVLTPKFHSNSQLQNRPFHFAKLSEIKIKFFPNVLADCCYMIIAEVPYPSSRSKPRTFSAQPCSVNLEI